MTMGISRKRRMLSVMLLFALFLIKNTPGFSEEHETKKVTEHGKETGSPVCLLKNTIPSVEEVAQKVNKIQIPFIANNGQLDDGVAYYSCTFGGTVFVKKTGELIYFLPNFQSVETNVSDYSKPLSCNKPHEKGYHRQDTGYRFTISSGLLHKALCKGQHLCLCLSPASFSQKPRTAGITLKEEFLNGNIDSIRAEGKTTTEVNYFHGRDASKWEMNIPTFQTVNLGEIYKGIELKLKAYGNNVEKLFYVKPAANPEKIQIRISGARSLKVNKEGQLEAETELGNVTFTKPVAYQMLASKKEHVDVSYHILPTSDLIYAFNVGEYDRSKELVIDPLLASTFLGGHEIEEIRSMSIDNEGYIYVAGITYSNSMNKTPIFDLPTTTNAYDTSYNGDSDVFVSRFDGELKTLLASTYLGGSGYDGTESIAIDQDGNVFVAGNTSSLDFPITNDAYQSLSIGYSVGFVSKLDANLSNLLASTYFGLSDTPVNSIAVGSGGNVYVVGSTEGDAIVEDGNVIFSFKTTPDAYDTSLNGGSDIFVSKFSGDLTDLLASTLLGGTKDEVASDITVDLNGNIYVTGETDSSDFPITSGAYDASFTDESKVFVSRFDGELKELLASTYLGGSTSQKVHSMTVDKEGNIFVTGITDSIDFPVTTNAYDPTYNGGIEDGFVSKFNESLTDLLGSTYLGGVDWDVSYAISIDSEGNVYVAGKTVSTDFPTTADAYASSKKNTYKKTADIFISKLDGDLNNLLASTYFGGSYNDEGRSLAINSGGTVYVSGYTWGDSGKSDFPTTGDAYDDTYNDGDTKGGGTDGFVAAFDKNLSSNLSSGSTAGTIYGCVVNTKGDKLVPLWVGIKGSKGYTERKDTDENGCFEFTDLEADSYKIFCKKKGYDFYEGTIELEEGEEKQVTITMTEEIKGSISGYVMDSNGKTLLPNWVGIKGSKGYKKRKATDKNGYFKFKGLDADTYLVIAHKKGYNTFKEEVILEEGETKEIKIVMKFN